MSCQQNANKISKVACQLGVSVSSSKAAFVAGANNLKNKANIFSQTPEGKATLDAAWQAGVAVGSRRLRRHLNGRSGFGDNKADYVFAAAEAAWSAYSAFYHTLGHQRRHQQRQKR